MTNKEFFLKTIEAEAPVFLKVLNAIPKDAAGFKPHEKSRPAGHLAAQLAVQPKWMTQVIKTGTIDFREDYAAGFDLSEAPVIAEKNFEELKDAIRDIQDAEWENQTSKMVYEGGEWEDKKFNMDWGLLFDAIHHRGQLSTYLRIMGAKVPSIYGGSSDEPMG